MGRVFILGAGASLVGGYPLALDLWKFVRDSNPHEQRIKQAASEVTEVMERLLRIVPPSEPERPNLEALFTLLDSRDQGVPTPPELQAIDWRGTRPKLMLLISGALLLREYQFQEQLRNGSSVAAQALYSWAEYVRATDTIITFNWDIMHEAALWRSGKWHYSDGYGFMCTDAPAEAKSPVKILKLHGSANWAQEDESDCRPSIEHKATFFRGASDAPSTYLKGAGQWSEGRNLIIPSYLKDVSSNRLLLSLWSQAAEALEKADQVTVIGFSLNRADALARYVLGSSLARNNGISEVSVVMPTDWGHTWGHFCSTIGKARKLHSLRFEDWVCNEE